MISFNKIENSNGYYSILINGEICKNAIAYKSEAIESDKFDILAQSYESSKQLSAENLHYFGSFSYIELPHIFPWLKFEHTLGISPEFIKDKESGKFQLTFSFSPKLYEWKEIYSFKFYVTTFKKFWESESSIKADYREFYDDAYGFELSFTIGYSINSIETIVHNYAIEIRKIHDKTINFLLGLSEKGIQLNVFNFPQEIKTACEQYLLYFAQFLQDLGINVTSNLKEEAGKVLFSVTPADETQALDKIREALAVYLKLPESPIIFDDSFKSMRLQQQIENLQHSQKMAARELQFSEKLLAAQSDMLHEKNITISQQQSVIENQQKIIEKISSKSIMMDSIENKEELEEIYDGIKVGESESLKKWLGISLNPAKAIKTAVKNTFGKEDKPSILDFDEE